MNKFPTDVPREKALKVLEFLGLVLVREGNHIAMVRQNADGSRTPLTLPNHQVIKGSTLRLICTQVGISRAEFLDAFKRT
jgi:predicted RNA binding protein YcfA (HicA-like mRNA interferase family)